MKHIRVTIRAWLEDLDQRWQKLPVKKQHRYTLYFFLAYLCLSIGVIVKVGYDTVTSDQSMDISHIENPVLEKKASGPSARDSVTTLLKKKLYER